MELLKETIEERDVENMKFQMERVDTLRQKKLEEREVQIVNLQKRRIQVLREMAKKGENLVPNLGRDIIEDYSDFGSNIYAPITRIGLFPDQNTRNYDVFTENLYYNDGIEEFIDQLPEREQKLSIVKPPIQHTLKREERRVFNELEYINHVIETKEESKKQKEFAIPAWRKPKEKITRPETPTFVQEEDEEFDNAILLIQKLLRGRAVQNIMFEGKEKRLPLIKELRSDEYIRYKKE